MQVRAAAISDTPPTVPESLDLRISALSKQRAATHVAVQFRWKEILTRRLLIPAPAAIAAILLILASLGALVTTLTYRAQEQAQIASGENYILLLPPVEVRGIYHAPSQNIH